MTNVKYLEVKILFILFMVYLTTLSVALPIQRLVVGLINNELEKEAVVA
jgi:hypothetical protein